MSTPYIDPFDWCRRNIGLALRLLSVGQEWRQQTCAFEAKRVELDLAALRETSAAFNDARDLNQLFAASHAVMSRYPQATTNLWQEGMSLGMRNQTTAGEVITKALEQQGSWLGGSLRICDPGKMPSWINGFGSAMTTVPGKQAGADQQSSSVEGERHAA